MRLRLSRRAQADLDDIRDYSVERFGLTRAIAYLDGVEQAFRLILRHPEIGSLNSDLGEAVRSTPSGEHRVFYTSEADDILILRILHKHMDVSRHL